MYLTANLCDCAQDAEWVENDERIPEIKEAESVIDKYRAVYDGTQDDVRHVPFSVDEHPCDACRN